MGAFEGQRRMPGVLCHSAALNLEGFLVRLADQQGPVILLSLALIGQGIELCMAMPSFLKNPPEDYCGYLFIDVCGWYRCATGHVWRSEDILRA